MSCCPKPEQPALFEIKEQQRPPGRRNPLRKPAKRDVASQVHLPVIVEGVDADLLRLEALAATQRPVTRGDCEQEARPCPWVSCHHHVYYERFEEFERLIDLLPDPDDSPDIEANVEAALVALFEQTEEDPNERSRRPKTTEAVAEAVHEGRALYTSEKGGLHSDVLTTTDIRGPWPTCSLDVAADVARADAQLSEEDTARILGNSREAIRQIEDRVAPHLARDDGLRPWLEDIASEEKLVRLASLLDWFGD